MPQPFHLRFRCTIWRLRERATFFLYDESGNALEFKAFQDSSQLFAH